ncbi:MAG: thiamine pyrophosphate-requiring protein [Subtercola sp.]|nr:thiamine pyrophosphate-requiring protein [Subtercola sp.]
MSGETAADSFVEALHDAGVEVIFGNLGSDHPAIIEALAAARERGHENPAVVLAPHEASALAAAHGYALVTGRPQAVFVHVDVGTANLGGGVHNAARARVPVLIFAGLTPFTLEGELPGTRNHYPNHLQDVHDQHGLVRPYVKWSYDLRTGLNARQVVFRALQLSESAPQGPVYLTAAREVLASTGEGRQTDPALWRPIDPIPAPTDAVHEIAEALAAARFPLIVTSALGRNERSVADLVELAELLGIGVVQPIPSALNFPSDHELQLGYATEPLLDRADVIVVIDCDAPWMLAKARPSADAAVYYVDSDPLKQDIPLWYTESRRFIRADSGVALQQLLAAARILPTRGDVDDRVAAIRAEHEAQRSAWEVEVDSADLTAASVSAAVGALLGAEGIVLNEAITNSDTVFRHIPRQRPGSLYSSGGSSLGWSGGAAVGVKLARPDAMVVSIVGDGTFFFSIPSSTYWMAKRYGAPFLTVILDNGGWNATKQNVVREYSGGVANSSDQLWVNLGQTADQPGIAAAAGDALAVRIESADELEGGLRAALDVVRAGRSAVVSVRLHPISGQQPDAPRAVGATS